MAKDLLDQIGSLTLVQAAELVKAMEEKFGISATMPAAVAAAPAGTAADAPGKEAAQEKSEFKIILEAFNGEKKVDAIKKVREITGLPLMEAKKMVESGNGTLKEGAPKEEAEKIKADMESIGCKISLQ